MAKAQTRREHTWHYAGQNTFGSFLKQERTHHGFSRHYLAITTGIQERVLAEIELNRRAPSYGHLKILAVVLGIPEQALLEAAGCIKQGQGD